MATHSSILAWRIPWTVEPGGPTVHGVAESRTWLSDWTTKKKHQTTIFNKVAKNAQRRKDSFFDKRCWGNWTATCKRMKLDPYLTKISSKWMKDLDVRHDTIKVLEENTEEKLLAIGLGNDFLDVTSKAQSTEAKINKQRCIWRESVCTAKETMNEVKRQPQKGGKYLQIPHLIRGQYPNYKRTYITQ